MSINFSVTDKVAMIAFDRPDKLNALTDEMWDQLAEALDYCKDNEEVRAVILTGTGRGFCAGADISGAGRIWPRKPGPAGALALMDRYDQVIRRLYHLPKPTIAAVNGAAVGIAWTLVLCCDAVLATEKAKFLPAFLNLAKIPEGGFQFLLARLAGQLKARDITFRSQSISGAEAVELGLATRLVSADNLLDEAKTLAGELGGTAPVAFALAKQLFNDQSVDFDGYLRKEMQAIALAATMEDAAEGMAAFKENRAPEFRGV